MVRNWIIILLLLILVSVIAVQWAAIVRFKRRQRHYQEQLATLQRERDLLEEILANTEDEGLRQLLGHRASLISRLLLAGISGDSRESESLIREVETLVSERETFMHENRRLYERWQPRMVAHLRECGLTDEEVEVCCLYALGLNGKAIQQYTQDGRHYQNVGIIRKKLGLGEHDRNIDGYIKSLME